MPAEKARLFQRPRLFYGWYIVGVALLAQCLSAGTQAFASGLFLTPMTQELGWSRESFSAVQTVSTFVMGGIGLLIGGMVDRRGPRRLMLIGTVIAGGALVATSRVDTLWQFYLVRGVAQTVGNALLGNLVVNVTVAKWFVVRRGMAVAIASLGISLGGVLVAPLVALVIEEHGWRAAWVTLGIAVWLLMLPSALIMRRQPEDFGLAPDGMTPEQAQTYAQARKRASAVAERQWTRSEALRTSTIWLVIFAYGVANIGLGALLLHLVPFLTDHGRSRPQAAFLLSLYAWAALLSKPVWGTLMDRLHARFLSAIAFALSAVCIVGMLAAAATDAYALLVVMLLGYGFGTGGSVPLQETVWASYFGRVHLGSIRAVAMPFTILFSATGPLLAGTLYDRTGSYGVAFLVFAACALAGVVLVVLARPPHVPQDAGPPPGTTP